MNAIYGFSVYIVPKGFIVINPKNPMLFSNPVEKGAAVIDESTGRLYCVEEDYDKLVKATQQNADDIQDSKKT